MTGAGAGAGRRLGWFVLLWLAGVLALGSLAFALRGLIRLAAGI
ncbi:MAG: hypothetical protein U1E17_20435 [Geminicoccaceae bacterium]